MLPDDPLASGVPGLIARKRPDFLSRATREQFSRQRVPGRTCRGVPPLAHAWIGGIMAHFNRGLMQRKSSALPKLQFCCVFIGNRPSRS